MNCYYCQNPLTGKAQTKCYQCPTVISYFYDFTNALKTISALQFIIEDVVYTIYFNPKIYSHNYKCKIIRKLTSGYSFIELTEDPQITPSNAQSKLKTILTFL